MKKDKLRISNLSVKSFVTSVDKDVTEKVKGGHTNICPLTLRLNESLCAHICVITEQVTC